VCCALKEVTNVMCVEVSLFCSGLAIITDMVAAPVNELVNLPCGTTHDLIYLKIANQSC